MGACNSLAVRGVIVRLSPDSARTKNTMANIVASKNISRTAFDLFILVTPFLRVSVPDFLLRANRTAADALRFNASNIAQEVPKKASTIFYPFTRRATEPAILSSAVPARVCQLLNRPHHAPRVRD